MTDQNDPPAPARPVSEPATPASEPATPDPDRVTTPGSAPGSHRPTGSIIPRPVQYKGQPLEPDRGPGLGCFRFQLVLLVVLIFVTPLSVGRVPDIVTAGLLFVTIGLLLVSGQTIIFLLRLVAADRRGRRQPLAPRSPTVGQLEDGPSGSSAAAEPNEPSDAAGPYEAADAAASPPADAAASPPAVGEASVDPAPAPPTEPGSPGSGPVRQ